MVLPAETPANAFRGEDVIIDGEDEEDHANEEGGG